MSVTVSAAIATKLVVTETLGTNVPAASNPQVVHDALSQGVTLNSGSTPSALQYAADLVTLSSGAASIDLTSVSGTNGAAVNGNGQKVIGFQWVRNGAGESHNISMAAAGSNGYAVGGTGSVIIMPPNSSGVIYFGGSAPVIGGTAKAISLTGTGAETVILAFLFGS